MPIIMGHFTHPNSSPPSPCISPPRPACSNTAHHHPHISLVSCSYFSPARSDTPTIMDYIKLKHEVTELEKQLTDWKRKIDILTMEKTRKRTLLKSVAGTGVVGAGR